MVIQMTINESPSQLIRLDPLIGCGNLLSFTEALFHNFPQAEHYPLSIISLDVNSFASLNDTRGYSQGDAVLRLIGIVLMEETRASVFRIGGDEFTAILDKGTITEHEITARKIYQRLNNEATQFGLCAPAAAVALITYDEPHQFNPADVIVHLSMINVDIKKNFGKTFRSVHAHEFKIGNDISSLRWISNMMVNRIMALGTMLDESQQLAYTDPVTNLPNMRAAQHHLERAISRAKEDSDLLALLLIDGDDLRRYNKISYAAGDDMINRLGSTLNENLRPGDFLARWCVGDEFLILLPGTNPDQANAVGKRLCRSVEVSSKEWILPVTISIGVACYPQDGETAEDLLHQAEMANDRAKGMGKNRVIMAE